MFFSGYVDIPAAVAANTGCSELLVRAGVSPDEWTECRKEAALRVTMLLNPFLMGICIIIHQSPNALWRREWQVWVDWTLSSLSSLSNHQLRDSHRAELLKGRKCCASVLKTISVQHPSTSLLVFGCHKALGMDPSWQLHGVAITQEISCSVNTWAVYIIIIINFIITYYYNQLQWNELPPN